MTDGSRNNALRTTASAALALTALASAYSSLAQDSAEERPQLEEIQIEQLDVDTAETEPVEKASGETARYEDDELQEIRLPSRELVEDEVYLEGVDEGILDAEYETDAERLARLFRLYLDSIAERSFAEADALAKQIVELTIEAYGLDSDESAKALTNLAIAQHGIEDHESAILNYEAAVGIIERIDNMLSYDLINPLRGMGAAHLAAGRPDLARDAFDRAVHISHVNQGPHNLEQLETLEALAETYLSVGEMEEAVETQKRIYYLQARNVEEDSLKIIPALRTRANWQNRMQLFEQERFTWRKIISVIEKNEGNDSLDLIEPLTKLGKSYLYVSFNESQYYTPTPSISSGEIYLKRAVRIAEANPEAGWQALSDAMLELGDYYMMSSRPNRALRVYKEVWDVLSAQNDSLAMAARAETLETPRILQDIQPPKLYGGDPVAPVGGEPTGYETGSMVYEYGVSTRGRPLKIELVESDPAGLNDMYESVGRQLRELQYRPRFENGEVAATEKVAYEHDFFYRKADLPETAAAAQTGDDTYENP